MLSWVQVLTSSQRSPSPRGPATMQALTAESPMGWQIAAPAQALWVKMRQVRKHIPAPLKLMHCSPISQLFASTSQMPSSQNPPRGVV